MEGNSYESGIWLQQELEQEGLIMDDFSDIDFIFRTPKHFGLRGDDYLWLWLRDTYTNNPTHDLSELASSIKKHLEEFGVSVDVNNTNSRTNAPEIYIKAFDKGGMSSGIVSAQWWQTTGFPLLKARIDTLIYENSLYLSKQYQ